MAKKTAKKPTAVTTVSTNSVDKINVRMYRAGTGDFFILQFKAGNAVTFQMMFDCGCIGGGVQTFQPLVADLHQLTGGVIDLLVVTHEHADHINGFEKAAAQFKNITFKKVWFAWTESKDDPKANDYRKNYTKIKMALAAATTQLNGLVSKKYYNGLFKDEQNKALRVEAQEHFINSLMELNALNTPPASATRIPTMEDLLRTSGTIKAGTEVRFLEPGTLIENEPGAKGIRFFIMGPPKDLTYLGQEEKKGEGYEKREKPSTVDFSFINALDDDDGGGTAFRPFERQYELTGKKSQVKSDYQSKENQWRNIDHDWLFSAGSLALRFQKSINNTSLVIAIQFEESERILLFPGDAEYGNWMSWHDKLEWSFNQKGETKKVKAEYILNKTVFYKVGHHLSQNGTAKAKGFEMMKSTDLVAMATLDFKKINKGWLNTMPNDIIGAGLINKTKGRLFFVGDATKILKNIKTKRVTVNTADAEAFDKFNKEFNGKFFIDYEVQG